MKYLDPKEEPTQRQIEEIERQLGRGTYFDEEFDDFQIQEEDFTLDYEDDIDWEDY